MTGRRLLVDGGLMHFDIVPSRDFCCARRVWLRGPKHLVPFALASLLSSSSRTLTLLSPSGEQMLLTASRVQALLG